MPFFWRYQQLYFRKQTSKEELQFAAEIFGMQKQAMVANFVDLPEDNVFWTVYTEYEEQRTLLGEERYKLLLEYAGNYVNYTDARLETINAKLLKLRKSSEKLRVKYFKKNRKRVRSQGSLSILDGSTFLRINCKCACIG